MRHPEAPTPHEGMEHVARLLLAHRREIDRYIRRRVDDPHTAEDVFQDVAVVLMERWRRVALVTNFRAFALAVARRTCARERRKQARLVPVPIAQDRIEAPTRPGPSDDRAEGLWRTLGTLPERWRRMAHARYWLGRSASEIAAEFGSTCNAVRVTLHRIRARIAGAMR